MIKDEIMLHNLKLHNRLVMPPMATHKASDKGHVSDALCAYYEERTKGDYIGLVIVEHAYVAKIGQATATQMAIDHDDCIVGLKKLVDTIHHNDTKVIAQIAHAGGVAKEQITGISPISASACAMPQLPKNSQIPKEIHLNEIPNIILDFTKAALRAKEAGFDGVEIHAAHGYLLNQFYSPLTNHRKDVYGKDTLEGRIRLHLEIIESIRDAVGKDYPIAIRFGACDYSEGGSSFEDGVQASIAFEKAGVNLLDISGGLFGYMRSNIKEPGYFQDITSIIKEQVTIPVLLTGGIVHIQQAEAMLQGGFADLIGVGRALFKDANWAKTAMNEYD